MKAFYKSRIKTAKMLVMQNLIFSGHHKRRGVDIAGFEMLSKTLPLKHIGIAEDGIKDDLRTKPRPWQVWFALLTETTKTVDVQPFIVVSSELTSKELDGWLAATIQSKIMELGKTVAGYCWAATPCMTFDLEASEEKLIDQFKALGVLDL